jgi:hypothetical protein
MWEFMKGDWEEELMGNWMGKGVETVRENFVILGDNVEE